jgi:pentatricopeptide repeat protein
LGAGRLEKADALYEASKTAGVNTVALINLLLQYHAQQKDMSMVQETWLRMEFDDLKPDEMSYSLKMKAQYHINDIQGFFETWEQLKATSPQKITSLTYNLVALTLAHNKETGRLKQLLREIESKYPTAESRSKDVEIEQSFLVGVGLHAEYPAVVKAMDALLAKGIRITNQHCVAVLVGLCAAGNPQSADSFINNYIRRGLIPQKKAMGVNLRVLYRILLAECIETREIEVAKRTFEHVVQNSVQGDTLEFETNCMIQIHLDREEEDQANIYLQRLIDMTPMTVANPLPLAVAKIYMSYFTASIEPRKALKFWQAHSSKIPNSSEKLLLGLEVYALVGESKSARAIFDSLLSEGLMPTAEICQSVMRAYVSAGDSKRAISMFEETMENGVAPTAGSYNLIVGIYASRGDVTNALKTIESMKADKITPDADTYSHLIDAYIQTRKWDMALSTFDQYFTLDATTNLSSSKYRKQRAQPEEASETTAAPPQTEDSKPALLKPSTAAFAGAFLSAWNLNDASRVARYWKAMKPVEHQMNIEHFLPALNSATPQPELFSSMIAALGRRISKNAFRMTHEQAKTLAKHIRTCLVVQGSPMWNELESLSQTPGRNFLKWEERKAWGSFLKRLVVEKEQGSSA